MGSQSKSIELRDWSVTRDPGAEGNPDPSLAVNVIYTTLPGTLAALRTADQLGVRLNASISFLIPQTVPLPFTLTSPPVSVPFAVERYRSMAEVCREAAEVSVQVFLCRDKLNVLLKVLKPQSLVVVGGRKRWWPTPEEKLARVLESNGHRVIFVDRR